jgi:putative CocE/NonD family hydrolase
MKEPPLHYAIIEEPGQSWSWNSSDTWPLPEAQEKTYYFREGKSGSVNSVNDGRLLQETPPDGNVFDIYAVDYSTGTGEATRWHNGSGVRLDYPDLTQNDGKSLTFTTDILEEDLTVTGHPLVSLYLSSSADDGDFYVYLEEVNTEGVSQYISEGQLRASCRALGQAPYNNLGLPYYPLLKSQAAKIKPEEIFELKMDLHPISNVFNKGHRIRVTINCADSPICELKKTAPAPTIKLHRGMNHASRIVFPVVK